MGWLMSWPVLVIAGYLLVFISLYLACLICDVSGRRIAKVASASLLPAAMFDGYSFNVIFVNWDTWHYLSSSIQLLPFFLAGSVPAMLLGAPWFLRSAEGNGWGRAWGAAAVGGILLSILALLMLLAISPQFEHARQVKSLGDAAAIAAQYRLPVPADSELRVQTNDISRSLLKQRLKNPQPNRSYGDWTEVWPCNEQLSLYSNEEPPQLAKFLAGSLTKAGYRVQQGETIIYGSSQAGRKYGSKAGQWVAGAKPGLFVVYQCNYVGSVGRFTGTYGVVRIWRDFAKEMEAECAAAAAQGKSK